jgi:hypothetical protein
METSNFSSTHLKGEVIMAIVTVEIGLAKNVFAVYGVGESGKL